MFVQVLQVVMNMNLSYSGRDFAPPVPVWWSISLRGIEKQLSNED